MADKIGQYLRNKWNFGNRRALFPKEQDYMWAPGSEPESWRPIVVINSNEEPAALPGDTPIIKSIRSSNTTLDIPQVNVNKFAIAALDAPEKVTEQSQVTPAENPTNYTIQSGDTLGAIAKKYGVALSDLAAWNNIKDPNRIYAGQTLVTNGKPGATQQTTAKSMTSTKQQVSTPVRRNIPMENTAVLNVPTTIPSPSAITMPVNTNVKSMISPDNYILSERDRRRMFKKALAETRKYQIALNNGEIDRNDENLINERTARLRSLFNFASAGNV